MALLSVLKHICPKGHPLISNLQMKLEAFLLLKVSTAPSLPPSPPEISHVFCGPLRLLLRNPKHEFFRVFPYNSQLVHPSSTLTAKIPQILQEPSKKPPISKFFRHCLKSSFQQGIINFWNQGTFSTWTIHKFLYLEYFYITGGLHIFSSEMGSRWGSGALSSFQS